MRNRKVRTDICINLVLERSKVNVIVLPMRELAINES